MKHDCTSTTTQAICKLHFQLKSNKLLNFADIWQQDALCLITGSDLHLQFRLGISTISGIVEEVCKLIWNVLQSDYMPIPDTAKWLSIAHGFQNKANFPN